MKKLIILLLLITLPAPVFAQTTDGDPPADGTTEGEGALLDQGSDEGDVPVQSDDGAGAIAPVQSQVVAPVQQGPSDEGDAAKTKYKLKFAAINSKTERLLGDVNIVIDENGEKTDQKLSDPPKSQNGEDLFEATAGKYEIVASRAGYKNYEGSFEIKDKDLGFTLKMVPLSTTPDPKTEFLTRYSLMQYAMANSSTQGFPYAQTNPYQTNPTFGNPNYGSYGYPTYTQNGYALSANQQAVVPLALTMSSTAMFSSYQSFDVQIVDLSTSSIVSLINSQTPYGYSNDSYSTNLNFYDSINRYGCLKPNSSYLLRIVQSPLGKLSANTNQDYPFQSSSYGTIAQINIQNITTGIIASPITPNIQNIPFGSIQIPINCPSSYNSTTQTANWPTIGYGTTGTYGTAGGYGTTTWADPTINTLNFGSYEVQQNAYRTGYFLVNKTVLNDARIIQFVENDSGSGGLAFVSAQSGTLTGSQSAGQWYVTTYTRNTSQQVNTCRTYLGKLTALGEFKELGKELQSSYQAQINSISSSTVDSKTKYRSCITIKNDLSLKLGDLGATIPAFEVPKTDVNVNISKFYRVNLSPSEYANAISGKVLTTFEQ